MTVKIALALGGGVARGWAHIGVLRALARHGIEPDIVCGTSIGSVVGGLYCAGRLDALELWARALTRRKVFGLMDFAFGGGGLFGGARLAELLQREIGTRDIGSLGRPFAAVATEITTGQEIWLRHGPLAGALQASYALPGVFAPRLWDGRWLADGALVNPCPISVARALGGRLVIGVSLHSDTLGPARDDPNEPLLPFDASPAAEGAFSVIGRWLRPDRLILERLFTPAQDTPAISTVMLSALNILLDRVSRARLAGDPPDLLITPHVGRIGLLEFHRAHETIALGYEAAEAAMPRIADAMQRLR